ncbi:hypothetical protein SDC9_77737 [bioreactor metagenome]|uniref:Hemerythrin-like domain-containing protein n=1 Tax=bioreactor metagenome TaxID=1076179 RepID=A0A644YXI3_9ZZZZ
MKATQQLRDEHEGIKIMLSVMDRIAEKITNGESPDSDHLDRIIEFIRVFADKCHHSKEEDVLFPALQAHGMPKEGGPIGVMLSEHQQGRLFVKALGVAINDFRNGNKEAASAIALNALSYTFLLRNHIEKENNVLFKMADEILNENEQELIAEEFEKIEVERIGLGKHEEFHALLKSLKSIYLNK